MSKFTVYTDGLEGFKARSLAHARALDHGDSLHEQDSITFASVGEMLHMLTPRRVALLEALTVTGERPVTQLARDLKRKRAPVLRDLNALRKIGVISTRYHSRAGQAKVFTAKPLASRFDFICRIDRRNAKQSIAA